MNEAYSQVWEKERARVIIYRPFASIVCSLIITVQFYHSFITQD